MVVVSPPFFFFFFRTLLKFGNFVSQIQWFFKNKIAKIWKNNYIYIYPEFQNKFKEKIFILKISSFLVQVGNKTI